MLIKSLQLILSSLKTFAFFYKLSSVSIESKIKVSRANFLTLLIIKLLDNFRFCQKRLKSKFEFYFSNPRLDFNIEQKINQKKNN